MGNAKRRNFHHDFKELIFGVLALALAFCCFGGCAAMGFETTTDAQTGETQTSWNAATAKQTVDGLKEDIEGAGGTVGVILSGVLAALSAGLGVAVKVQASSKNKTITALSETIKATAATMSDEDVQKLIELIKAKSESAGTAKKATVASTVAALTDLHAVNVNCAGTAQASSAGTSSQA